MTARRIRQGSTARSENAGVRSEEDVAEALRGLAMGASTAADRVTTNLVARAADEGLLDVAYATLDSPVGPILAASTPRGVVRVSFSTESADEVLADLAASVSPRILEAPARLEEVRRELDEYFGGERKDFELALDWRLTSGFRRRVLRATARIPYGETATYAEVAGSAGNPRAYRAVGSALGGNPIPIIVRCEREVRSVAMGVA